MPAPRFRPSGWKRGSLQRVLARLQVETDALALLELLEIEAAWEE
jgi:hypothetical protein